MNDSNVHSVIIDDQTRTLIYDGKHWFNADDDELCWLVVKEIRTNPVFKQEVANALKLTLLEERQTNHF